MIYAKKYVLWTNFVLFIPSLPFKLRLSITKFINKFKTDISLQKSKNILKIIFLYVKLLLSHKLNNR